MAIKFKKIRSTVLVWRSKRLACLFNTFIIHGGLVLAGEHYDTSLRSYYPVKTGLVWIYRVAENNLLFLQQVECSLLADSRFMLCTKSSRQTQYFFKIDKGFVKLVQIKARFPHLPCRYNVKVNPDLPVFNLYGNIGDSWRWQGCFHSLLKTKKAGIQTEIMGFDQLKVNDQNITCLKLFSEIIMDGKVDTLIAYYAKDVGLIKQVSNCQNKALIHFKPIEEIWNIATSTPAQAPSEEFTDHLSKKMVLYLSRPAW